MEKRLEMTIEPRPKERPRASVIGGHARIYTPKTTETYENNIRKAWVQQNGEEPLTGPVVVRIHFGMPIPKSVSKKNRIQMLGRKIRPVTKPDIDNLAKSILDAINGVAYKDDNQIVTLMAKKYYTEIPCVRVIVADWIPKEGEEIEH